MAERVSTLPRVTLVPLRLTDGVRPGLQVFTIVEQSRKKDIGSATVQPLAEQPTAADLGFVLHDHDHEVAVDTLRALASWAFRRGTVRVQLRCPLDDLRDARAALGAGFRYEGVRRGSVTTEVGVTSSAVFAQLPGDSGEPIAPALPDLPDGGLRDGVVTVRMATAADAAALHAEHSNPEAARWSIFDPVPESETSAMAERAALDWLVGARALMVIVDDETGEAAGKVVLRPVVPPRVADVGAGALPKFRGRRYVPRAVRLVTDWAFTEGGYVRLEAGVKAANTAAGRSLIASGWEFEGQRPARLRNLDETFSDELHYSIVHPRHRRARTT